MLRVIWLRLILINLSVVRRFHLVQLVLERTACRMRSGLPSSIISSLTLLLFYQICSLFLISCLSFLVLCPSISCDHNVLSVEHSCSLSDFFCVFVCVWGTEGERGHVFMCSLWTRIVKSSIHKWVFTNACVQFKSRQIIKLMHFWSLTLFFINGNKKWI